MKNKKILLSALAIALLTAVWTGCEKDYNYVTPKVVVVAPISFSNDIQPIFNNNGCSKSGCHDNQGSLDLDLTTGDSYASLMSNGDIDTTNAANSDLYKRVTDPTSNSNFMPKGGSPISSTDCANILAWITQGYKNN